MATAYSTKSKLNSKAYYKPADNDSHVPFGTKCNQICQADEAEHYPTHLPLESYPSTHNRLSMNSC